MTHLLLMISHPSTGFKQIRAGSSRVHVKLLHDEERRFRDAPLWLGPAKS